MKLSDLTPEDKLELLSSLRIEGDITSSEYYTGGMNGSGSLYANSNTLKLRLIADIDGESHDISECEVDL